MRSFEAQFLGRGTDFWAIPHTVGHSGAPSKPIEERAQALGSHALSVRIAFTLRTPDSMSGAHGPPGQLPVSCGGRLGSLNTATLLIRCGCATCAAAGPEAVFTLSAYEKHCGRAASKCPKMSIRLHPSSMTLARWLAERPTAAAGSLPGQAALKTTRQG